MAEKRSYIIETDKKERLVGPSIEGIKKTPDKLSDHELREASKRLDADKSQAREAIEKAIHGAEKQSVRTERTDRRRESTPRGIKKQQYKVTMRRVEARLPFYERAFSKVIHNPTIDKASNIAGKTIARPSGLLGAAIAGSVGLLLLYLNARRIGFEYSIGSAFFFFTSIGWLTGILIEYIVIAVRRLSGKN